MKKLNSEFPNKIFKVLNLIYFVSSIIKPTVCHMCALPDAGSLGADHERQGAQETRLRGQGAGVDEPFSPFSATAAHRPQQYDTRKFLFRGGSLLGHDRRLLKFCFAHQQPPDFIAATVSAAPNNIKTKNFVLRRVYYWS